MAIDQGAKIEAYYHWSLTDTFESSYGHQLRYGLFYVDFPTGRLTPKAGARLQHRSQKRPSRPRRRSVHEHFAGQRGLIERVLAGLQQAGDSRDRQSGSDYGQ